MKKTLITTLSLLVLVLTPLKANAFDWGNFFRWFFFGAEQTQTVSTEDLTSTLSDIQKQIPKLDETVQKSFLATVPILTSENDANKLQSELKKINESNATASEKDSQILKLISNYTNTIKGSKVGVILIIKTLSDSNKNTLKNEITKIAKAGESYNDLSNKASNATSKISKAADDEQAKVISELKSLNTEIKKKANAVNDYASQVKILSALAGLNI